MIKIINRRKNSSNSELQRGGKLFSGRWLFYLTGVFFLATIIFSLFFSDFLNITSVKIFGLDKIERGRIDAVIAEKLEGKYFGMVSKTNLVLFPARDLAVKLVERFPRSEEVLVRKKFPNEINVSIKERIFSMLLCSSGDCYLINERGEAYPAKNFTPEELEGENLITLNDLSGAKISLENNPLEDSFREFILKLGWRVSEEAGIELGKNYETPSRMSGDLKIETSEGWKIYFSESVGLDKELFMLRTVLERKIEKEQLKNLEYIDLRIPNKVFYKFKEGIEQVEETEKTSASEVKKEEKKKK